MFTKRLYSLIINNMCRYSSHTTNTYKVETQNLINSFTDKLPEKEQLMLKKPDYFNVHNLFTVEDLFEAKVHYGHKLTSLNNGMKPFIFGHRLGHTIFDLDKTAYFLRKALNFVSHIAYRKGVILFISQNPSVTLLVENTAKECEEYAVARDWTKGVFVEREKVFKIYNRLPDVCIILNVKLENNVTHPAVLEAAKACIPTVGIVDSNADPNLITYPVPGNDDSHSAISLYCDLFKKAIMRAKKERIQDYFTGEDKEESKNEDKSVKNMESENLKIEKLKV